MVFIPHIWGMHRQWYSSDLCPWCLVALWHWRIRWLLRPWNDHTDHQRRPCRVWKPWQWSNQWGRSNPYCWWKKSCTSCQLIWFTRFYTSKRWLFEISSINSSNPLPFHILYCRKKPSSAPGGNALPGVALKACCEHVALRAHRPNACCMKWVGWMMEGLVTSD